MANAVAGFRVGPEIGHGAMGVVHLAEDEDGRRVALKLLAPELARDERFRRRFLREAALAASIDHPSVVATVGAGEADGLLFLALAYVDGEDLRAMLRREGALAPQRALSLADQVADALDAAHAAGLVHRDVKPSNILVAGDAAFVCDFGLARHVSSVGSLTGDRGFVGTIDYVAPEQIAGHEVDGRADQYALACTLFECLAGARPYQRDSDLATVFAHLNEAPPRLTDYLPTAPRALNSVFARALAKDPGSRYRTCGEFVEAARSADAGALRPRRRVAISAVAAAVVVAVSAAAFAGFHAVWPEPANGAALVSQSAIDGVRLGMTIPHVKRLLGSPWREDVEKASGFRILIFHQRRLAVYFDGKPARSIVVTTWNRDFRTAAGVGPCSSIAEFRRAYGAAFRASRWNRVGGVQYGYTVGRNLFVARIAVPQRTSDTVGVVALFDGDGPKNDGKGVNVDSGTLPFAGYIALSETMCSR
jgi:protein kinase-like protein